MKRLTDLTLNQTRFLMAGIKGTPEWPNLLRRIPRHQQNEALMILSYSKDQQPVKVIEQQLARQMVARRQQQRRRCRYSLYAKSKKKVSLK